MVLTFRDKLKTTCLDNLVALQFGHFQAIVLWAMANGFAPVLTFSESPIYLSVFCTSCLGHYFYWIHRFLHWPPMYRIAHALHHRSKKLDHGLNFYASIEHFLFIQIFWFILFWLQSLHLMFHGYMQSIHPIFSHSGFEKFMWQIKNVQIWVTFPSASTAILNARQ